MPISRVLTIAAVLITTTSTSLHAGDGFGIFRSRRSVTPSIPRPSLPLSVLQSPEKMTELFGPSILVREPAKRAINPKADTGKQSSRFVRQPDA
ncbi:MAG: hypothetical protein AAGI63_11890 [Planctomycetota bacterium]